MDYKGYKILTHKTGREYTYSLDGVKPIDNYFASENEALAAGKSLADYFETLI